MRSHALQPGTIAWSWQHAYKLILGEERRHPVVLHVGIIGILLPDHKVHHAVTLVRARVRHGVRVQRPGTSNTQAEGVRSPGTLPFLFPLCLVFRPACSLEHAGGTLCLIIQLVPGAAVWPHGSAPPRA